MIILYNNKGEIQQQFNTQTETATFLNVSQTSISKATKGTIKTVKNNIVVKSPNTFVQHCLKFEVPFYHNFYKITGTTFGNTLHYSINLTTLIHKFNLHATQIFNYITNQTVTQFGIFSISTNLLMTDFNLLLPPITYTKI